MTKKTKRSSLWIPQKKKIPISKNSLPKEKKYVGLHLIADFWYGKNIDNQNEIEKILIRAAKEAKNHPLKIVTHKFSPQGMTGVVLLAESHIALHFWPEINYLAVDIFTCGEKALPEKALNYLKKIFKPKMIKVKKIKRGIK